MAAAVAMPLREASRPPVPYGRRVELPRRGTTFVREVAGPPGAPTLLLLHGWVASAGLNWYQVYEPLSQHFNIIAPDMRGHARGLRARKVFRLSDCADDAAAMLCELRSGPVIAVGYSMGGPVSQLLWRRHRDLVDGLVLCATTAGFVPSRVVRRAYQAWMFAASGAMRAAAIAPIPNLPMLPFQTTGIGGWAAAEMRRHNWRMIVEAGHSISTYYAGDWIGEVDVPTSVVCTTQDRGVPPSLQIATAEAIPGARVYNIHDGHLACASPAFIDPLLAACTDVADRIA
jgi:pimeloyl-ACP methyl ester carboxylesterase